MSYNLIFNFNNQKYKSSITGNFQWEDLKNKVLSSIPDKLDADALRLIFKGKFLQQQIDLQNLFHPEDDNMIFVAIDPKLQEKFDKEENINITKNQIQVLYLTDIHENFEKLEKLIEIHKNDSFDFIFAPGDFCNLPNREPDNEDQELAEKTMIQIFEKLSDQFKCQILYVPGNHDPKIQFKKNDIFLNFLTKNSINLHKNKFNLQKNLHIMGIGGSVPSFKDNETIYKGFPYEKDDDLKQDLKYLNQHIGSIDQKSCILMTHCGPDLSQTSQMDKEGTIHMGSKNITSFLKDNSDDFFLCIHGHSHDAQKFDSINNIPVLNAGSFLDGNYGILNFEYDKMEGWKLKNHAFFQI